MTIYIVSVLDSKYHKIDGLKIDDKKAMVDYVIGMRELGYQISSISFEHNWLAIIVMVDGSAKHIPTQKCTDHMCGMWFFENRRETEIIKDSELRR